MAVVSYLFALLTTLYITSVKGQTGFMPLPGRVDCPSTVRFRCISTGRGRTVLTVGDDTLFSFSHFEYAGGANINESQLDGNITAGNLSRSAGMECSDMTDYCYTMFVEVHLTEQTSCRVISCTTILLDSSEINVGSSTASRSTLPPTPMNLRILSQSENSVTFGWNPGSSTTCSRNYSVSIMNCGTCNQDSFVSRTNVTCDNLEPGQQMQCSVTVQSVTECGIFSAPLTDVFKVLSTESTAMTTVLSTGSKTNVEAIIGGCFGAVAFIGIVLLLGIILVIRCRRSTKRDEERLLTQNTPTPAKQSQTVSGLDNKPIPMESLDKLKQDWPQAKKAPTDLDQPPSSEAQAVATGAGEPQSSEQSQSETSVNGAKTDVAVIIQQSVSQDHQADPKAPTNKPTTSGAQAAATGAGEPQSLKQSQSETCTSLDQLNIKSEAADIDGDPDPSSVKPKASVSNVGTDEPDSQQTVPHDYKSELKAPTDQPHSSGGETTANGPGGQQSLERNQSEDPKDSSTSAAGARATGTNKQEISIASDVSGGSKMVIAPPRPCKSTQHSDTTRTGLAPTIAHFSEEAETGREHTQKASLPSEHNRELPKKEHKEGVDARNDNRPVSVNGKALFIAGDKKYSDGVGVGEFEDMKKQIEDIRDIQDEQGKKLIQQGKKLVDQEKEIDDLKTENRLNIQRLTTDIADLKAEIERLTGKLREKGIEVRDLKQENKVLKQENKTLKEENEENKTLKLENEELKRQNEELTKEKEVLKQEKEENEQENKELKLKLIQMVEELETKTELLEQEERKRIDLEQRSK